MTRLLFFDDNLVYFSSGHLFYLKVYYIYYGFIEVLKKKRINFNDYNMISQNMNHFEI